MQFRSVLLALSGAFLLSAIIVACGFEDFEVDFDTPQDFNQETCDDSQQICDEETTGGPKPPQGNGAYPVTSYPGSTVPREEEPSQPDNSDDEQDTTPAEPDDSADDEPDFSCSADPDVCRYCGPAEDVVIDCPPGDPSFECQVFELVNQERVANGLNAVTYNATLAESAMIHAMDLSICDYFAHDSLDGTSFFERCEANGYSGNCTGENIGGGQTSPQAVFDAWMASPGHRDNILYPHHDELGVAYYEGSGTYSRYWLKHFGRP